MRDAVAAVRRLLDVPVLSRWPGVLAVFFRVLLRPDLTCHKRGGILPEMFARAASVTKVTAEDCVRASERVPG